MHDPGPGPWPIKETSVFHFKLLFSLLFSCQESKTANLNFKIFVTKILILEKISICHFLEPGTRALISLHFCANNSNFLLAF